MVKGNRNCTKDRVVTLLRGTGRNGIENAISHLDDVGYFDAGCYGHHTASGGMAEHALEVYDCMRVGSFAGVSVDSAVIAALFHDLGKSAGCRKFDGGHGARSICQLDEWGVELTEEERSAIACHHKKNAGSFQSFLRVLLSIGDCCSTGIWKRNNGKERKNGQE